jgi:23S rRNA (adenine2503-C2)-methyltransferase
MKPLALDDPNRPTPHPFDFRGAASYDTRAGRKRLPLSDSLATMTRPLLDASRTDLETWMAEREAPKFHARQVFRWVFERRAESFAAMTDLPRRLRDELERDWSVYQAEPAHHGVAPDGTEKLLLQLRDGRRVECVLMAEDDRRTVCISTQVGCGMGCVFCASGLKGVERNLTTGEILEQVLRLRNLLPPDERLTNLVVMGMGESLANLDNLIPALDAICSPDGLGMGQRRITISTVGLPDKMLKLAQMDRQYHLAVSLHAAIPEIRDRLVPINARVGLGAVMAAADAYFHRSGRQVTFEYVLLAGLNDRRQDAEALGRLLAGRKAHVNVIPYNPVAGLPFRRPSDTAIGNFVATVRDRGVSVSVRKTKGREIDAACGQLRRRLDEAAEPVIATVGIGTLNSAEVRGDRRGH